MNLFVNVKLLFLKWQWKIQCQIANNLDCDNGPTLPFFVDIRLGSCEKKVARTASEDRRCFQRFKHDIYVASGPSVGFSKPLCLHSLCSVTYVICNLHAKKNRQELTNTINNTRSYFLTHHN